MTDAPPVAPSRPKRKFGSIKAKILLALLLLSLLPPIFFSLASWYVIENAEVGVSVPVAPLLESLETAVLVFFVVMLLPLIFAAVRISRGIVRPIAQLGEGVKRIGGGNLENYRPLNIKTNDEIEELANAFNQMASNLLTYVENLKRMTAEKERNESELRLARDVQMNFLKKDFPPFPGRSDFSLYAAFNPAHVVGGDLYDFELLDDSRLLFYVGDVVGKGFWAALIMGRTMLLMTRASLQPGVTPAGILHQVNKELVQRNKELMFVTMFVGILDLGTGELAFSNAAHTRPVIQHANGECSFLELREVTKVDDVFLGTEPKAQYHDCTVVLERGAAIVIYTDGVTEARSPESSPERKQYSESRLLETVVGLKGRPVEDTVEAIVTSVKAYEAGPQSDDITVLAVRRG